MVYHYDDVQDTVTGSEKIEDRYKAKQGQTETIPNNIDAVIFDPRNNHLFFFKGLHVSVTRLPVKYLSSSGEIFKALRLPVKYLKLFR